MDPLVKRLENEVDLKVERLEIWRNKDNAKLMKEYDKGHCGGIPFFFSKKTGKWICGSTDYDQLKEWATE